MNLSPMFRLFTDNITIVTVRISVFRELFESLSAASLYRTSKQDASSGDMTKVAEFCAILFFYWLVTHYRNVPIDNCRPWKVGYPLGLENKNEVSKATAIFSLFWTLWQLTIILTLSRTNVKTIRVGYHCFSVGMSLSLLQRRKYLCKEKHFLLHLLKIKINCPEFGSLMQIKSIAKLLKLIKTLLLENQSVNNSQMLRVSEEEQ